MKRPGMEIPPMSMSGHVPINLKPIHIKTQHPAGSSRNNMRSGLASGGGGGERSLSGCGSGMSESTVRVKIRSAR
jgi:hypothetical protein